MRQKKKIIQVAGLKTKAQMIWFWACVGERCWVWDGKDVKIKLLGKQGKINQKTMVQLKILT